MADRGMDEVTGWREDAALGCGIGGACWKGVGQSANERVGATVRGPYVRGERLQRSFVGHIHLRGHGVSRLILSCWLLCVVQATAACPPSPIAAPNAA